MVPVIQAIASGKVLYKGILHFVLLAKLINFKEQLIRA